MVLTKGRTIRFQPCVQFNGNKCCVSCPVEYFTCQQQQLLELLQLPELWRLAAAFDGNTGAGQTPGGYIDVVEQDV